MADANGEGPIYQVDFTDAAIAQARQVAQRAIYLNRGWDVAGALRHIIRTLKAAPREFGDPMYRLRKMKMRVYSATHPPLYIQYGVHDERPVVIVRRVVGLLDQVE